jgi:hypothetical protein
VLFVLARARKILPRSFSSFVFQWEEKNFERTENQASALLFSKNSGTELEAEFRSRLEENLYASLENTRILPQLHYKPALLAGILIFLGFFTFQNIDLSKSRLWLSVKTLLNPGVATLTFKFPSLKKSYLRGIPFPIEGIVEGEPLFPIILDVTSMNNLRLREVYVAELRETEPSRFRFKVTLEGLQESIQIQARSGTQISETKILNLVELPALKSQEITIKPPPYTKAPSRILKEVPRTILQGSLVVQKLVFNKEVSQFNLLPETAPVTLTPQGTTNLEISFIARKSLSYRLDFVGIHGFSGRSPSYYWKTYPDRPPGVEIHTPSSRHKIPSGSLDKISLDILAEDDHSIEKMTLEVVSRQRFEMTYLSESASIVLTEPTQKRVYFRSEIELPNTLYLREGDSLTLHALVWDSLPSRPPTRSATHVMYVPYYFQEQEQAEEETEEVIEEMEELVEEEMHTEKEMTRLAESVSKDLETHKAPATRESLEEMFRRKQEIQKKAEELEKKLDKIVERDRNQQLLSEADMMKMQQIQELYQDVMRDMQLELSGLEQLARQASQLSSQHLSQMLQSFDKDKFSQELERSLKSLQKIKARRNLKKNLEKLSHLAKEHEKLSESLEKGATVPDTVAENLQKQYEDIRKELEELSKDQNLDGNLRDGLKQELEEKQEKIEDSYQELSENLKSQDSSKSLESNQKVQRELMKMSQQIQSLSQESEQKVMRVNLQKLDLFLRETLEQAKFLENTRIQVNRLVGLKRKRFAARQLSFLDSSSRALKEQIGKEYESNLNFQKTILQVLNMLANKILTAVASFESDRAPRQVDPIMGVFRVNNQLTLILLHLKEQLQKQNQQGDMSQFFESLEQMANQESQIRKGTKSTSASGSMQQQKLMEQLAFQQQLVRESTQSLYQKYQEKMELARGLQGLAKEMKEVEEKLRAGDGGEATQEKQKRIEYKLLEARDALKEQKEGKERKARTAKKQSRQKGVVATPGEEGSRKIKMEILDRGDFPPSFKDLVDQYFRALQEDRPSAR